LEFLLLVLILKVVMDLMEIPTILSDLTHTDGENSDWSCTYIEFPCSFDKLEPLSRSLNVDRSEFLRKKNQLVLKPTICCESNEMQGI